MPSKDQLNQDLTLKIQDKRAEIVKIKKIKAEILILMGFQN